MTKRPIIPTDPEYEAIKGRIPVWLSEDQVQLLLELIRMHYSEDKRYGDLLFRLSAAVHKSSAEEA
jgi:hypothetical protein